MAKKTILLAVLGAVIVLAGCAPRMAVKSGYDFSKVRRVAVLDFAGDGAQGVADVFILELMRSGLDIAERSKINNILREQELGVSGKLEPSTAQSIGKILGVDAILTGSVSQFLPAQKRIVYFSAGDTPVIIPGLYVYERGINYVVYMTDAEIGASARLIDVETGSVVWAASDAFHGFTTDSALQGVVASLAGSLISVFPKNKK